MTKIGTIESNYVFTKSFIDFFEAIPGYSVVFQFSHIKELIQQAQQLDKPHVIIIDFDPLETGEPDTIRYLKKQFPTVKLVVFTSVTDVTFIVNCLKSGADSYLLKTEGLFELHRAIKENMQNGLVLSPMIARQLITHVFFDNEQLHQLNFTCKEKEIVNLVREGLSYKQMAIKLNVTPFTINHHLKKIYKKGGVNSRSQLMVQLDKFEI